MGACSLLWAAACGTDGSASSSAAHEDREPSSTGAPATGDAAQESGEPTAATSHARTGPGAVTTLPQPTTSPTSPGAPSTDARPSTPAATGNDAGVQLGQAPVSTSPSANPSDGGMPLDGDEDTPGSNAGVTPGYCSPDVVVQSDGCGAENDWEHCNDTTFFEPGCPVFGASPYFCGLDCNGKNYWIEDPIHSKAIGPAGFPGARPIVCQRAPKRGAPTTSSATRPGVCASPRAVRTIPRCARPTRCVTQRAPTAMSATTSPTSTVVDARTAPRRKRSSAPSSRLATPLPSTRSTTAASDYPAAPRMTVPAVPASTVVVQRSLAAVSNPPVDAVPEGPLHSRAARQSSTTRRMVSTSTGNQEDSG